MSRSSDRRTGGHRQGAEIDLLEIIDQLEQAVLAGHRGRLGGGWVVDREQMLDLVDRLRSTAPASLQEAQELLTERDHVLEAAREEAQLIARRAQEEAELRLASHELVTSAEQRANDMLERAARSAQEAVEHARDEAAAMRGSAANDAVAQALEADRYSLELLRRLAEHLGSLEQSVASSVSALEVKLVQADQARDLDARDAALASRATSES